MRICNRLFGPCSCPICLVGLKAASATGRARLARERAAWAGLRAEMARRQVLQAMRDLARSYAILYEVGEILPLLQIGSELPSA